jgi:ABC-type sugar transport system ATPase subunit
MNLEVRAGEIVGFAGLLGSGRTEALRAIFRVDRYDSGEVLSFGRPVRFRSPGDAVRAGFTFLPADRKGEALLLPMSVKSNITLSTLRRFARWMLVMARLEAQSAKALVRQLAVRTPSINTWIKYLSGGNQQKALIARALCSRAKILLFDEPTAGIDVGSKAEIYELLGELARKGAAILISSSDIAELVAMSDRIVVMRHGRIAAEVPKGEATEELILQLALGVEPLPS